MTNVTSGLSRLRAKYRVLAAFALVVIVEGSASRSMRQNRPARSSAVRRPSLNSAANLHAVTASRFDRSSLPMLNQPGKELAFLASPSERGLVLRRPSSNPHRYSVKTAAHSAATSMSENPGGKTKMLESFKIGGYFLLWYALNVVYNIYNKQALNALPLPWTLATLQLGVGFFYASALWTLRLRKRPPALSESTVQAWAPIALAHGVGQVCTVCALGGSTVAFVHIIKALEPFFSAVLSSVILKQTFALPVYLSLVPVVGGVALACFKSLSFSWLSFLTAMGSNAAFALRAIFSKKVLQDGNDETNPLPRISAPNLFGVVTGMAFFALLPISVAIEWNQYVPMWEAAMETYTASRVLFLALSAGLFHYLNNEVMYFALDRVHPITLAVGNTLKRVFILVASVIVFRTAMSTNAIIGASIAIPGTLVYSLTKQYYDNKARSSETSEK